MKKTDTCITESLCCTPEINTLIINYTLIQFFKISVLYTVLTENTYQEKLWKNVFEGKYPKDTKEDLNNLFIFFNLNLFILIGG